MSIIGARAEKVCYDRLIEIKVCDICGADATDRTPCRICKRDICANHQRDMMELRQVLYPSVVIKTGNYDHKDDKTIESGIYCTACLASLLENLARAIRAS